MRLLMVSILALGACGESVKTDFEAKVVTIANLPFGLGSADAYSTVTGSFSWHTANLDSDGTDEQGVYMHPGDGVFEATLPNGVEITGSGFAEVRLSGVNTFNYFDGAGRGGAGTGMSVDGELDESVELSILMVNAAAVLTDDTLPPVFPDLDAKNWTSELTGPDGEVVVPGNGGATTFSLSETNGTVLMQFTSLSAQ